MQLQLYEGGNVFGDGPISKQYVRGIVDRIQLDMPSGIKAIPDIGSAGYKVESGDMDLFVDYDELAAKFKVEDELGAKKALAQFFAAKGYPTKIVGRNVHLGVKYKTEQGEREVQVDLMVIRNAAKVAPWHQHGPRGMYDDPNFKAAHLFMLLNSIGKFLGVKTDAFAGTVMRRDNNEVVADTRKKAAKLLLGPTAKEDDLNSVASVMAKLKTDPDKEGKLAQARQDVAKGLITLPEDHHPGTAGWFRNIQSKL
jgi:hypothetical protein